MKEEASTFRVMDNKGNTINLVMMAETERPNDPLEIRIAKRRASAEQKRDRWSNTHFNNENLMVVPCDMIGKPIKEKAV